VLGSCDSASRLACTNCLGVLVSLDQIEDESLWTLMQSEEEYAVS